MSRNDAEDYAQRLYSLMPAHYVAYDQEQGQPLLALMRVVGEQVANLRRDMDDLWENFFIETCDDWVVPYLGALVGTKLLARPVGQSNRLDVRNTVLWSRNKGTPAMLAALAAAISGWSIDLAEYFQSIGWSQNMNHLRVDRPLLPDLRAAEPLGRLGLASDPLAHAIDIRAGSPLDQPRTQIGRIGTSNAAWGTPGRYQLKNLGFLARRLKTYLLQGVTPAANTLATSPPQPAAGYSFDPRHDREPLFMKKTGAPLTRVAFGAAPWETFGVDLAVRQFGVPLASNAPPLGTSVPWLNPNTAPTAFTFGGQGAGLSLDAASGLRLLEPRCFSSGSAHFVITALWQGGSGAPLVLGRLSTLHAGLGDSDAFHPGTASTGPGQLVIRVEPGSAALGWPGLPTSRPARFPGAILAVRAARSGAQHTADGLYVYLPPARVASQPPMTSPPAAATAPGPAVFYVTVDGSTYLSPTLDPSSLGRSTEGNVYPPCMQQPSVAPAYDFTTLNRGSPHALWLPDPSRFGGAAVMFRAVRCNGSDFDVISAIATVMQAASPDNQLAAPSPWPAFTAAAGKGEQSLPSTTAPASTSAPPILAIEVLPLAGNTFVPPTELVVVNRSGQALLVYLPELAIASGVTRFFVADDGSTYEDPVVGLSGIIQQGSFAGLTLARGSFGQALPIPGVWPLQQRRPVALNLCRFERNGLLRPGELGIDPELGRFAFAPGDPAIGQPGLSVDYVEAFSDDVGARTFDRKLPPADSSTPLRVVSQSGDTSSPVAPDRFHTSFSDALANAQSGDVIEIADSATYYSATEAVIPASVQTLTIRAAAGQRPCLSFFDATGAPTRSSLRVSSPMTLLDLNGLFISGGPIRIEGEVRSLSLFACTLDPRTTTVEGSLVSVPASSATTVVYRLQRCITGGLSLALGVDALVAGHSIIDQQGGMAISGLPLWGSPPSLISSPPGAIHSPPASMSSPPTGSPPSFPGVTPTSATNVQLEHVTVLGQVQCQVIQASECLFTDVVIVDDQQSGCFRYSRYERRNPASGLSSALPRKFQCVPAEQETRLLSPVFYSLQYGRPAYCQLAAACPPEILTASEAGAEVGAFADNLNAIRLSNLALKIQEFLPAGLSADIIALT
jgi:hypothetical protein